MNTLVEFKKHVNKLKDTLTDIELFLSEASHKFFSIFVEGVTKRYGRVIKLFIINEYNTSIAYCASNGNDDYELHLNIDNTFMNGKTREQKFHILKGLVLHECGHILYTDFALAMQNQRAMQTKSLYPAPYNPKYAEYKDFVSQNVASSLIRIWQHFDNILEDGFIEKLLIQEFTGYSKSLVYLRQEHFNEMETFEEMTANGLGTWSIALNLLLCYAKFGNIKFNESNKEDVAIKFLFDNTGKINQILAQVNAYERQRLKNDLFVDYVLFIKEVMDDNGQQGNSSEQNGSEQGNGQQGTATQHNGSKQNISSKDLSEILEEIKDSLSEAVKDDGADFTQMGNSKSVNLSPTQNTDNTSDEVTGNIDMEQLLKELETLLNKASEEKAEFEAEKELEKSLRREMKQNSYGTYHTRTTSSLHRKMPTKEEVNAYNLVKDTLLPISKKLQGNLKKELKDMREGGKERGLYSGRKLDTSRLYRYDKKIMMKNIRPENVPDLAVCLLVDESGSMSGEKIRSARDTAFIIYDFCKALDIPIAVYGHTADCNHVDIYSYAEFNSVDGKDKYRIMGMQARQCNRDGYALRYAVSRLEKQMTDVKLMIVISDGRPNDSNYGLSQGILDIQKLLVEKAKRKDMKFITAGIGKDISSIQQIYIDGLSPRVQAKFLQIDNLETLPKTLVGIIKKYVKG